MPRQRLEISIGYTDKKGQKRYLNKLGNLWIDTETLKGTIDLPPGVSIHGGEHYINVDPPREREQGGERRGGAHAPAGGSGDQDDIPFAPAENWRW